MKETSPKAVGLFVAITAALLALGVWMLAIEGEAVGLLPIAFGVFNVAIGIVSARWRSR